MQNVSGFYETFTAYIGNNIMYIFIPIASLVFCIQLEKKYRKISILVITILLIVVYNPISYKLVEKVGEQSAYYRFIWIIPSWMAIGYLLFEVIRRIEQKQVQFFLVCIICAGIIAGNVSNNELKLPENEYQISYEIIEIAEQINLLMKEDGITEARIVADYEICSTIRQYDANILFPLPPINIGRLATDLCEESIDGVISMICNNRADIEPDAVTEILQQQKINYIVISKECSVSQEYLISLKWEISGESENYYILKNVQIDGLRDDN